MLPRRTWDEWMASAERWVGAIERAYVDDATGTGPGAGGLPFAMGVSEELDLLARAGLAAVASRYLAIGTPRTLGIVGAGPRRDGRLGQACVATHRLWNPTREVRCADPRGDELAALLAGACGGRVTTVAQALACDIVCLVDDVALAPSALRGGTHVNILTGSRPGPELAAIAVLAHELAGHGAPSLGQLAAGLVDGRQRDEITIFAVGPAQLAAGALAKA
ncbi:MAG: hypothetical protein KBG28_25655 [Kofleriaceae bacterium]|nr:hypothetical protein [Kofleriaceae bacterium]